MYAQHGDWIQKERNGFWFNTKTNQESVFHPMALEIGGTLYAKGKKWCDKATSDRNKRTKDKSISNR